MMSLREAQAFWLWVAEYYGHSFSENQLAMYAEDVMDLNLMDAKRAFITYRREPSNSNFPAPMPSPARLRGVLMPEVSLLSMANEVAGRIYQALSTMGGASEKEVQAFLGEVGWRVVEREGGWTRLRQTSLEAQKETDKAQWRGQALAILERAKSGTLELPPALPMGAVKVSDILRASFPTLLQGGEKTPAEN